MTIAVLIAGGTGARMGQDIPKQFINVYDKARNRLYDGTFSAQSRG